MKTKALIFASLLAGMMAVGTTSCGSGCSTPVNNDSIVSPQLVDSMSMSFGAFLGANWQSEAASSGDVDAYIEGFQLIVAQDYSDAKLMGMRQGLFVAEQIKRMNAQGVDVNRDLFLQEFRRYLQNQNLTVDQYTELFNQFQDIMQSVDNILMKREEMRGNANAIDSDEEEEIDDVVVVEPDDEDLEVEFNELQVVNQGSANTEQSDLDPM